MGELMRRPLEEEKETIPVDTYVGRVYVEWDTQAEVTPFGPMPFMVDFLKSADLYQPWVKGSPLNYPIKSSRTNRINRIMFNFL